MLGMKDDELELLMTGDDDLDLGSCYKNEYAHLAASLPPMWHNHAACRHHFPIISECRK